MNKLSRRGLLVGSLAAAVTGGLSACGGRSATDPPKPAKGADSKEILFWNGFTGGDGAFMKKIVDGFNKENKDGWRIKMLTIQWGDLYSKIPTAVQAGKGPDICAMHTDSVGTNAARGVIKPIDDITSSLDLSEGDFAKSAWEAGLFKDERYALPLDVHPLGFYYNKDVMEKGGLDPDSPPMTMDAYMNALDKLKSKGIKGHWASPFTFTGGLSLQSLIYQFGGSMYSKDLTAPAWHEEGGIKAVTWWKDLIKQGYSPSNVDQDADFVALQNGENAFNWNGIWCINTLGEKKDLKWDVCRLPNIGGQDAAWSGSHQITRTKQSPDSKTEGIKQFLSYLSKNSLEWAKGGQIPARNSVRESAEFKKLKYQAALAEQVDVLHFAPPIPGIGDATAEFDKAINAIMLGGKEIEAELNNSAKRAAEIMKQNAEKYGK